MYLKPRNMLSKIFTNRNILLAMLIFIILKHIFWDTIFIYRYIEDTDPTIFIPIFHFIEKAFLLYLACLGIKNIK